MKLTLEIENSDIERIQKILRKQSNHIFVKKRIEKNLVKKHSLVSKEDFWRSLIMCLLTTQQRSGEQSSVTRFLRLNPNPLSFKNCSRCANLGEYAIEQLTIAKGIRRTKNIAAEIEYNFDKLVKSDWEILYEINSLRDKDDRLYERQIAENVQEALKGIGPKQSRNLLQDLGLTKYEIPIDSRIIKWLNALGFPIPLSSIALQDKSYYNFVSDNIFELCERLKIKPCVLDAMIFSSFEKE